MRKLLLLLPILATLFTTAPVFADTGQSCHTETRTRIEYQPQTHYEQRWVVDPVCGVNAWGVYVCVPVGHWVSVPVTTNVPVEVPYTVSVCE